MPFKINVLTPKAGWMFKSLSLFVNQLQKDFDVVLLEDHRQLAQADVTFILSYQKIISRQYLSLSHHNIVVHASALPQGRGWSPIVWQILAGENVIPVSLFEAEESLDSGAIYLQKQLFLDGTELLPEIRAKLEALIISMCQTFLKQYLAGDLHPKVQQGKESYYRKRTPEDSELNIDISLREQFNLLRTVDNEAYPAYFYFAGRQYIVKIEEK